MGRKNGNRVSNKPVKMSYKIILQGVKLFAVI